MLYRLFLPAVAAGANKVYFDLFNGSGSGGQLEVISVKPMVSGSAAVTGTLAIDLFLTRTTAVGTGGTAATAEGTSVSSPAITCVLGDKIIDPNITARLAPAGGATGGAVLSWTSLFTEETSAASYSRDLDLVHETECPGVMVRQGTGIRVVQGAIASVGNTGFNVLFRVHPVA